MSWQWAIGDVIILAVLLREWFSIRREIREGRELEARKKRQEEIDIADKT